MLNLINDTSDLYSELERKGAKLENGFKKNLEMAGVSGVINRVGSMMTLFFTNEKTVTSLDEAMKSDTEKYAKVFKQSLESGIYLAPSQFECLFASYAQSDEDIDALLRANLDALKQL